MKKTFYSILIAAVAVLSAAFSSNSGNDELRIIELVTLNNPYTLSDHEEYNKLINPIMTKNGITLNNHFQVIKKASGTAAENTIKIGVWNLKSMEGLQNIFKDKDYQKNVAQRDKIHDMANLTHYLAKPVFEKPFDKEKTIIVDFIVMNDGYGQKDSDDYFSRLEKIGKKHGLKRFAAYEVKQFMAGKGPQGASLINFYEATPETMPKLFADTEYQKTMVPLRDKIFNMKEVTVFLVKKMEEKAHCTAD